MINFVTEGNCRLKKNTLGVPIRSWALLQYLYNLLYWQQEMWRFSAGRPALLGVRRRAATFFPSIYFNAIFECGFISKHFLIDTLVL